MILRGHFPKANNVRALIAYKNYHNVSIYFHVSYVV